MKIFDSVGKWASKVNFVDENNVLVGYDMTQRCCERADWGLYRSLDGVPDHDKKVEEDEKELEEYVFDPTWSDCGSFDYGGSWVAFRLKRPQVEGFLYLVLSNCHNGYYSHGFTLEVDGKVVYDERL
jgi:hypothetical protein